MKALMNLLRKGVYPYEYMNSWLRFNEKSMPDKEAFYIKLHMDDITDVDHSMQKKCLKALIIKILVIIMTCMFRVIHYCL